MRNRFAHLLRTNAPSRSRFCLGLALLALVVGVPFYASLIYTRHGPSTPDLHKYLLHKYPALSADLVDAPPPFLSLYKANSPFNYPPPDPLPPYPCPPTPKPPILLALYVYSNARFEVRTAKFRRDVIRRTINMGVPHAYRHLVDVKFVMGRSWDPAQETLHDREENRYHDMLRVAVPDGDGDRGKMAELLRVIGGDNERVAQWVMKCDDDVIPILPNLIPYLLSLDPTIPTIIGSSFHQNLTRFPHFSKHMYGFSWGIARAVTEAHMRDDEKNRDMEEGLYAGNLMSSLPSQPGHPPVPPGSTPRVNPRPTSPDPRTGLIWEDVGPRISPWRDYWASKGHEALAWYGMQDDHVSWSDPGVQQGDQELKWQEYEDLAMADIIKDMHAVGRKYVWEVPKELRYLALRCPKP